MNRTLRRLLFQQPTLFWLGWILIGITVTVQPSFGQILPIKADASLPALQSHPLPPSLSQWQDPNHQGDYFDAVQPTPVGYLIWSTFPVKVYLQPPDAEPDLEQDLAQTERSKAWYEAVSQALQEWEIYLPLERVAAPETADIAILRVAPALQRPNPNAAQAPIDRLPRIRSAETRYEIYVDHSGETATLAHRFTIQLSPNQTVDYTKATARHELGHALGIWGHSPLQTDALYFSQVRNPPTISYRDINTLKRIYEQPTRLGWTIPSEEVQRNDNNQQN